MVKYRTCPTCITSKLSSLRKGSVVREGDSLSFLLCFTGYKKGARLPAGTPERKGGEKDEEEASRFIYIRLISAKNVTAEFYEK